MVQNIRWLCMQHAWEKWEMYFENLKGRNQFDYRNIDGRRKIVKWGSRKSDVTFRIYISKIKSQCPVLVTLLWNIRVCKMRRRL
jgi:hypothetical protein